MVLNKLNLELTSLYSSEDTNVRIVHSDEAHDMGDTIEEVGDVQAEEVSVRDAWMSFVRDEIGAYKSMRLLITVFKSLLMNKVEYRSIFSTTEINLLFNDINTLSKFQKTFVDSLVQELTLNSSDEWMVGKGDDSVFSLNIKSLISKCYLEHVNLGMLLNSCLLNSHAYQYTLQSLFKKRGFIKGVLNDKINSNSMVNSWLTESERMIKGQVMSTGFNHLLDKVVDRVFGYPHQLKSVMDVTKDKYDLNLALIKVNKILNKVADQAIIHDWEGLNEASVDYESYGYYDNNLEYQIESAHEMKVVGMVGGREKKPERRWTVRRGRVNQSGSGKDLKDRGNATKEQHQESKQEEHKEVELKETQDTPLIRPLLTDSQIESILNRFTHKNKNLALIHKSINKFALTIEVFAHQQINYSQLWHTVLKGHQYFDTMYERYTDKLSHLSYLTYNLQTTIKNNIILPLAICLQLTSKIAAIGIKRKFKSHNQFSTVQALATKLQQLIPLMNEFVNVLLTKLHQLVSQWLKDYIGTTKIEEYKVVKDTLNEDIVAFYQERVNSHMT